MEFSYTVDRIPPSGLDVDGEVTQQWVDFALGDLHRAKDGSYALRLTLKRRDKNVIVDGDIDVAFDFDCSRCAEEASGRLAVPIRLAFAEGSEDDDEEGDIEVWGLDGERELTLYSGSIVELESPVIEQIVFALPDYPVCREECRGLCSECGIDLNSASCACKRVEFTPDSPWAKLADIKVRG